MEMYLMEEATIYSARLGRLILMLCPSSNKAIVRKSSSNVASSRPKGLLAINRPMAEEMIMVLVATECCSDKMHLPMPCLLTNRFQRHIKDTASIERIPTSAQCGNLAARCTVDVETAAAEPEEKSRQF